MSEIIEITDLSSSGSGVGKTKEGLVVFTPYTAPGDAAQVELLEQKKNFAHGRLVKIITPSPNRIKPKCEVFAKCGGCDLQHVDYETQWIVKVKGVKESLKRVGLIELPEFELFKANTIWNYRNRIQLKGLKNDLGFYEKNSNTIVNISRCEIADEKINSQIHSIREENVFRKSEYKAEVELNENGNVLVSIDKNQSALGFRQIHDEQNSILKKWIADQIPAQSTVLDLFGGNGNLSLDLSNKMKEIYCIDDAQKNPSPPNKNYFFHQMDVGSWLKRNLYTLKSNPDVAIIDPPREGLGKNREGIISALKKAKVSRLIVVGCDPSAWAKDLKKYSEMGWKIKKIAVMDFFPQTHHVESVALLLLT